MASATLTTDSIDNGVTVGERAWPLRRDDGVIPDNYVIEDVAQVLIFGIQRTDICNSPASFDQFDQTQIGSAQREAMFQFVFCCLQQGFHQYYDTAGKSATPVDPNSPVGVPFELFLEVVLRDENDTHVSTQDEADREAKKLVAKEIERLYGKHLFNARDQMRRQTQQNVTKPLNIKFMRGFDDRQVFEYRFVLVVRNSRINFAVIMAKQLDAIERRYRQMAGNIGATTKFQGKRSGGGDNAGGGSAFNGSGEVNNGADTWRGGGSSAKAVESQFGPEERYMFLSSKPIWVTAVATYTRNEAFCTEEIKSRCLDANNGFDHYSNPAAPVNVFSAASYFQRIKDLQCPMEPRQMTVGNYVIKRALQSGGAKRDREEYDWRFPITNLVLRIPFERYSVEKIMHMYVPEVQKKMEPNIDWDRRNGHTMIKPARPESIAESKLGRASNDDDDDDQKTSATYGDADDEAVTFDGGDLDLSDDNGISNAAAPAAQKAKANLTANDLVAKNRRKEIGVAENSNFDYSQDIINAKTDEDRAMLHARAMMRLDKHAIIENKYVTEVDASYLAFADFSNPDLKRMNEAMAAHSGEGGVSKDSFHMLRARFFYARMSQIAEIKNLNEQKKARLDMQFQAFEEFIARSMSSTSNVSEVMKTMNLWFENNSRVGNMVYRGNNKIKDPTLSLFAHHYIAMITALDELSCVFTAHADILLTLLCGKTSYWYVMGLRAHTLYYGPPGSSKSIVPEAELELLIENTVDTVTSESTHAGDIDSNENDIRRVLHELPAAMSAKSKAEEHVITSTKNHMTAGIATRVVPEGFGKDGQKRGRRRITSEKQISFCACTNSLRSQLDSAFVDRFIVFHQVKKFRDDCDIESKMAQRANMSNELKAEFEDFKFNCRLLQYAHAKLEKVIGIGALAQPTILATPLVLARYVAEFKRIRGIGCDRRLSDKVIGISRALTVESAALWVHRSPMSPAFGKPFHPWHLMLANPWLKDCEEIAFFTLDLMRSQFVDPDEEQVLRILSEHVGLAYMKRSIQQAKILYPLVDNDGEPVSDMSQLYVTQRNPVFEIKGSTENHIFSQVSVTVTKRKEVIGGATSAQMIEQQTAQFINSSVQKSRQNGQWLAQAKETRYPSYEEPTKQFDYNYVRFDMTFDVLAKMIRHFIGESRAKRDVGEELTKQILYGLRSKQVFWKRYKPNPTAFDPPVIIDENSVEEWFKLILPTSETGCIYVHTSLVVGKMLDVHEHCINAAMNAFTPYARFISGVPADEGLPHILNVRQMGPRNGPVIISSLSTLSRTAAKLLRARECAAKQCVEEDDNFNRETSLEEDDDNKAQEETYNIASVTTPKALAIPIDEYVTGIRFQQIGMPSYESNMLAHTPFIANQYICQMPGAVASKEEQISYPKDALDEVKARAQIEKDLRKRFNGSTAQKILQSNGKDLIVTKYEENQSASTRHMPQTNTMRRIFVSSKLPPPPTGQSDEDLYDQLVYSLQLKRALESTQKKTSSSSYADDEEVGCQPQQRTDPDDDVDDKVPKSDQFKAPAPRKPKTAPSASTSSAVVPVSRKRSSQDSDDDDTTNVIRVEEPEDEGDQESVHTVKRPRQNTKRVTTTVTTTSTQVHEEPDSECNEDFLSVSDLEQFNFVNVIDQHLSRNGLSLMAPMLPSMRAISETRNADIPRADAFCMSDNDYE